jgi:hypothetical protein
VQAAELAAREQPGHVSALAVIRADRTRCARITRAGETGSGVLANTAHSQPKLRGLRVVFLVLPCSTANQENWQNPAQQLHPQP